MMSPHIHLPFDRLGDHLPFILEHRLNLELYFSSDMLDRLTADDVRHAGEELAHRPSLSFHAPFMDLSPAAVDGRVLETTRLRFNQILDLAGILHPSAIVVHSGYEKWKYSLRIDPWLERSIQTWRPLTERARDLGITIAVENIFEDEPSNLVRLMEAMSGEGGMGICFDTGHFNLFTTRTLEHWINALKPYIVELHLHDNNGRSDEHNPIGEGTFDFTKLLKLMTGKECIKTLEAHTPERVLRSLERYRALFG
jgi:sugar phosphate isomerase/epimerase